MTRTSCKSMMHEGVFCFDFAYLPMSGNKYTRSSTIDFSLIAPGRLQ